LLLPTNVYMHTLTTAVSIENLHALHALDLSHNRLSGQIPEGLAASSELHSIDLGTNRLEGTLPVHLLRQTSQLSRIDLSRNRLTGPIDGFVQEIEDPARVAVLNLGSNQFDGEIPSSLARFQHAKIELCVIIL
jgi:Leucine-rich repeat (LRR) protein